MTYTVRLVLDQSLARPRPRPAALSLGHAQLPDHSLVARYKAIRAFDADFRRWRRDQALRILGSEAAVERTEQEAAALGWNVVSLATLKHQLSTPTLEEQRLRFDAYLTQQRMAEAAKPPKRYPGRRAARRRRRRRR